MNESSGREKSTAEGTAKIIYILYLASTVFGVTGIIGVVMAYINRKESGSTTSTGPLFHDACLTASPRIACAHESIIIGLHGMYAAEKQALFFPLFVHRVIL